MLDDVETGEMRKKMREVERFLATLDNEMLVYVMQLASLKLEWKAKQDDQTI